MTTITDIEVRISWMPRLWDYIDGDREVTGYVSFIHNGIRRWDCRFHASLLVMGKAEVDSIAIEAGVIEEDTSEWIGLLNTIEGYINRVFDECVSAGSQAWSEAWRTPIPL